MAKPNFHDRSWQDIDWETWGSVDLPVTLTQGDSSVVLACTSAADSCRVNLDSLAFTATGGSLGTVAQMAPAELARVLGAPDVRVIDVRPRSEWAERHIAGVPNLHGGRLRDHLDELPRDGRLVLQCASGSRSAMAAAMLRTHGFDNVVNLTGGIDAWERAGLPVEHEAPDAVGAGSHA